MDCLKTLCKLYVVSCLISLKPYSVASSRATFHCMQWDLQNNSYSLLELAKTFAPLHRTLGQNQIEMGQNEFNGLIVSVVTKIYINT
jgi:hypothetical protein